MTQIFITRALPTPAAEVLTKAGHQVTVSQLNRPLTPDELIHQAQGVDALLSLLTDNISAQIMDALGENLKIISNYAVGFDNVDVKAASDRGIVVTNTPSNEVNEAVAEFTWALILSLSRRVVEADEYARKGAYSGWQPDLFLGTDVYGKTLGIIGLGHIGAMVARRATGFNMQVLYYKRTRDREAERKLKVKYTPFNQLLKKSDFVTLHVPLTRDTFHLIDTPQLARMKSTTYLINTSRGPVVAEHSLVQALKQGTIAGAALDVHENEMQMNPELLLMENIIMTPHVASATRNVRRVMGQQATTAILDTLKGQKPQNLVNPEVWKNRRK